MNMALLSAEDWLLVADRNYFNRDPWRTAGRRCCGG